MGKSQVFEARSQMPVDAGEVFAWHAREGAFQASDASLGAGRGGGEAGRRDGITI
jgi:hypothetical protein